MTQTNIEKEIDNLSGFTNVIIFTFFGSIIIFGIIKFFFQLSNINGLEVNLLFGEMINLFIFSVFLSLFPWNIFLTLLFWYQLRSEDTSASLFLPEPSSLGWWTKTVLKYHMCSSITSTMQKWYIVFCFKKGNATFCPNESYGL